MSSDMLTIGSALRRAEMAEGRADVLIDGHWLVGRVSHVEGDSAVLVGDDGDEVVLRLASVAAVRVRSQASTAAPARPAAAGAGPVPSWDAFAGAAMSSGTALDAVLASRHRS